jgi:hypothetical protein
MNIIMELTPSPCEGTAHESNHSSWIHDAKSEGGICAESLMGIFPEG